MKLHLDRGTATYRIAGYGRGYITVNEERLSGSALVMPERLVRDWPPQHIAELTAAHMSELLSYEPEIVLLGTGARQRFPEGELLEPLAERGVGVEVMDTAAACRTYNILMSEDRVVVAALLVIEE